MKKEELIKWLEYLYTKEIERKPNTGTVTDAYKQIWALIKASEDE